MRDLDIVIPVYNEGQNIVDVLDALGRSVQTPFRILICYDEDSDDTLPAVRQYRRATFDIQFVKNRGTGVLQAILSGFEASTAPAVLVFPADDTFNAGIIDQMVQKSKEGCDIVAASRLMRGGGIEGCPWLKLALLRLSAFTLYHFARIPTRDASNGFRLFSRRVLESLEVESGQGFAFSLELLVKCRRLGWKVGEVPALWFERKKGQSRFRLMRWLPGYLRWFGYAFATTYLFRGPKTVTLKSSLTEPPSG